MMFEIIQPVQW